jgi:hypothetical protein
MVDRSFLSKYCHVSLPTPNAEHPILFSESFVPDAKDVITGRGRGKKTFHHVGNRRFRVIIAMNLKKYVNAKTKSDKSLLVTSIVRQVREGSPSGAGFLKMDTTGRWMSLDEDQAREKVGHALRDAHGSLKQAAKQSIATSGVANKQDLCVEHAHQAIVRSLHLPAPPKAQSLAII